MTLYLDLSIIYLDLVSLMNETVPFIKHQFPWFYYDLNLGHLLQSSSILSDWDWIFTIGLILVIKLLPRFYTYNTCNKFLELGSIEPSYWFDCANKIIADV